MKKDLGIVLLTLDNDSIYEKIFSLIKDIIDHNPYDQICVFNSKNTRINTMNVPILHISQAKFFKGNLLVFDTVSLLLAKNFPNIDTIFLYATDIFWNQSEKNMTSYSYYSDMFNTQNLQFIVPNQILYDIYSICWKKPIKICEELKYDTIKQII